MQIVRIPQDRIKTLVGESGQQAPQLTQITPEQPQAFWNPSPENLAFALAVIALASIGIFFFALNRKKGET